MLASGLFVRQWRVVVETCWLELSLLCGFLCCFLLAAGLLRCLLLSTFFSCHSLVAPSFQILFFSDQPQDTVLVFILWARVNGAQHLAI